LLKHSGRKPTGDYQCLYKSKNNISSSDSKMGKKNCTTVIIIIAVIFIAIICLLVYFLVRKRKFKKQEGIEEITEGEQRQRRFDILYNKSQ
jgi:hypothetical protein